MRLQLITVPYRYDEYDEGLGAGPGALVDAGLVSRLTAAGHEVLPPVASHLGEGDRQEGRTALNIGRLGAATANLIAGARGDGHGALVIAGDDTAAVGVVAGLQLADGAKTPIGLVWLDAHGDFNTPETSFSGILAGMPVAILAGLAGPKWRSAAGLSSPVPTERILLAGVRELDEKEAALLRTTSVTLVRADELREGTRYNEAVSKLADQCAILSLHVDLDVLDPRLVPSSSTPSESGLEIAGLVDAMAIVLETGKVATVFLSGINPGGGSRGQRSIESALLVIERAVATWQRIPDLVGK